MSNSSFPSLLSVYAQLTSFANLSNFWSLFNMAFGSNYDYTLAAMLRSQWQNQNFSQLPTISVISGDILGNARGAYAKNTNTIYLSDRFVTSASQQSLEAVLLEEIGHFVDAQVNATDTPGDEGELFSALVRGVEISRGELQRLRTEDDTAVIPINRQMVKVEQNTPSSGVIDPQDYPTLAQDLRFLNTYIVNGQLFIEFIVSTPFTAGNIEFFLDVDQNPLTGDVRVGHLGGAEYRVSATFLGFIVQDFLLWQLPRSLQEVNNFSEISVFGNTPIPIEVLNLGGYRLSIPLQAIGNPRSVDVMAIAHRNDAYNTYGNGDRTPNYGTLDTSTGQLVIRRNSGVLLSTTINDWLGDNIGQAADLVSTTFTTEQDQFRVVLTFTQSINPLAVGFEGYILLDTDRNILTGDIPMGGQIATWGGDVRLVFAFNAGQATFQLQDGTQGSVPFGSDRNDGQWLIQGNSLILQGSLSLFDAYSISSKSGLSRVLSNGSMYAEVTSIYATQNGYQYDLLTPANTVVDTSTGQVFSPFMWDPDKTISINDTDDPVDLGLISGINLTRTDVQVTNNHLIIRNWLSSWTSTDGDNLFKIFLNTDMNLNTGFDGAEYGILAYSTSFASIPSYGLTVQRYNQFGQLEESSSHSSLFVRQFGTPASFTITLPFTLLGTLGSQLDLRVFTFKHDGSTSAGGGGVWLGKDLGFDNLSVTQNIFDTSPLISVNLSGSTPSNTTLAIAPTNVNQTEGNNGTKAFTFTVTRSGNLNKINTVNWVLTGTVSNSVNTTDFGGIFPSGILTFNSGESSKTITVNVSGDTTIEPDESLAVTLSDATNGATITTATAIGTILNDDNSSGTGTSFSIAVTNPNQTEGDSGTKRFSFTITRTGNTTETNTVKVSLTGTGTNPASGLDFLGASSLPLTVVITFAPGETSKEAYIDVQGDTTVEPDETFVVILSDANNGATITKATAIATILNDDISNQAPTNLSLSNSSIAENSALGTVIGNFTTTDPDTGNTFTYSLVTGTGSTDNALFTIQNNQLKSNTSLNFEAKSSYSIRVKTTDQGELSFEKQLVINITNVNETPSNLALSNSSIAENSVLGTVIGNFTTTDPDTGNTFTYSLVTGTGSTNNALFTIQNNQLKSNAPFDFETKNSYSIRVKTTDQGGLFFEKPLTINITDVNENPLPDLIPYKPNGWDDKLVISTQQGTKTSATQITTNDNLYVDWSYLNQGTGKLANAIGIRLLLDGTVKKLWTDTWNSTTSLDPNEYRSSVEDFQITPLSAGNHTLRLEVDYLNDSPESNESNNIFEKTFTVVNENPLPDLIPYKSSGWDDKLVISTQQGTKTGATQITTNDNLYIDWSYLNQGTGKLANAIGIRLLLDGTVKKLWTDAWNSTISLNPNASRTPIEDFQIAPLSAGNHTLRLEVDYLNDSLESNERNNIFEKTFTVVSVPPLPSITIANSNPVTIVEGSSATANLAFTVSLSAASSQTVTVNYTTVNGTATAGTDYTAKTGILTFTPGQISQIITVPILNDNLNEADETFTVSLSNGVNATINTATAVGTGKITDTLASSVTTILPSEVENLTLIGTTAINGTGNINNNTITGNSANNTLNGEAGNDTMIGGAGIDTLIGGLGDDIYQVDTTTDVITELAAQGTDTIQSSVTFSLATLTNIENLTLTGTAAINGTGNTLNNRITGNSANNILNGGTGINTLIGSLGDDIYQVDTTTDIITELATQGNDTIQSSVTFSLATLTNIENLTLTETAAINGTGNTGNNTLIGNTANNTLTGDAGNDILNGGVGIDTLIGGLGDDIYQLDTTTDVITELAAQGTDTIQSSVTFSLATLTNIENLTLTGTAAINGTGNTLNNRITGNSANNILNGGTGINTLIGSLGDDIYQVDTTTDVITELAAQGTDTVQSSVTFSLATLTNIENLTLTGTATINSTGNIANNTLIGNNANNTLTGDGGNDILNGLTGIDTLIGGLGDDTYQVDTSTDVITELASQGTDTIQSSVTFSLATLTNIENLTLTGRTAINGTGNAGNNTLIGNTANNTLIGDGGNDILNGLTGIDILIGGLGDDIYQVDTTTDVITELANQGTDTIQSSVTFSLSALTNIENLTLTGTNAINGTGNADNNTLIGNSANNILTGATGKDTLTGGLGRDRFGYKILTDSLLANFDVITDFNANASNDLLVVTTARSSFINVGAVATLDNTGIIAKLNTTNFGINAAAQFTFGTRSFVAINDGTAGFSQATDAIIEITGLTGTLGLTNFVTA